MRSEGTTTVCAKTDSNRIHGQTISLKYWPIAPI